MIKGITQKVFIIILCLISSKIGFSQDLTIVNYEGYDCRIDTTWHGGCENRYIYSFYLNKNGQKLKQTDYTEIKIRADWKERKLRIIDSTHIYKKVHFKNSHSYYLFSKMMAYILMNERSKAIGIDKSYFLDKEYLQNNSDSQIQDTMLSVKKQIQGEMGNYTYSSIMLRKFVEFEYKNVTYTFMKTRENIFWSVYSSKSDHLLFRFFYPDWNIFINNMLNTKRKIKNDLQMVEIGPDATYDIGRKILIPINGPK